MTSPGPTPASFIASRHGCLVLSSRSAVSDSSLALVSDTDRCFAPDASAVMNGRLMSVVAADDSSHFAFSAASRRRWMASLSPERSMPVSALNSRIRCWSSALSKSSPPRKVSPLVALTSKTPPLISRIDTSNVPPPRSYTAKRPSFLSAP